MNISASLVLYNSNHELIIEIVDTLVSQGVDIVYLVDNTYDNSLHFYSKLKNTEYLHCPTNPGFGFSHNIAINKAILNNCKFHFVVNPDISLGESVIFKMVDYMSNNEEIGMMMPKILNVDGSVQFLPKLLPSPLCLIKRKLYKKIPFFERFVNRYELRFVPSDQIYDTPILSGCFTLLNLEAINNLGSYDESFFMYFEDFDLSRRVNSLYKTIYFPIVHVVHEYDSGANKNLNLFFIFFRSAVRYFNKWGWICDSNRNKVNKKTLEQFIL